MTDSTLIDGVATRPATATDLATFKVAEQQLNGFAVPKLYDANDPHVRVFFVLSDGTGNDAINDPQHITNVGILNSQLEVIKRTNPAIGSYYLAGPGTQGGLIGALDGATGATYEQRVEAIYDKVGEQAKIWLQEDPNVKIRVIDIGFSRGAAQTTGVSNLIDQRGIQDPSGKQFSYDSTSGQMNVSYTTPALVAQGQVAQALGLYDPVGTGAPSAHDLQPSCSVISGFQINAGDEKRSLFPSTSIIDQYSADPRFLGVTTAGAHSDDGGGYLLNGLSTLNFNLMATYINGLMGQDEFIQKITPPADPAMYVIHKSEDHLWFYRALDQRETIYQLNPVGAQDAKPVDANLAQQFEYLKIGGVLSPGIPYGISMSVNQFDVDNIYNDLNSISTATGVAIDALLAANPGLSADMSIAPGTKVNLSISNTFNLTINPDSNTGSQAFSVEQGGIASGGRWQITADANKLNNDQFIDGTKDNTAAAAFTSLLANDFRPGNQNLADAALSLGLLDQIAANPDMAAAPTLAQLLGSSLNNADALAQTTVPTDPLLLDLNGDGVKLTDYTSAPVLFDIDHDGGSLEQTGWVGKDDGIAVMDINNNGKIDDIGETLSEYFNGAVGSNGNAGEKKYANGFAALKSLDSNNDNVFTAADAAWNEVKVWVDANHDGKSFADTNNNGALDAGETSELKSLAELGITQINLAHTAQSGEVRDGNEVLARGTFVQDGQTREALAANFLANPNGQSFSQNGGGITAAGDSGDLAYVSQSAAGEAIDVAIKGVRNAYGSAGADTLTGDANNNWLAGGQGSDAFNAGAGDDVLLIDADDLQQNIHGGAGMDIAQVVGDAGVTLNLAQAEIEIAQGGRGGDVLIGGGRSSVFIRGGDGDDILVGGAASDALSGEDGDDLVDGGAGNDVIRGHRGADELFGGVGDDLLDGGQDDDRLSGGAGNDVLKGGHGDDAIDGGEGTDIAEFSGSFADYRVTRTNNGMWISDTVAGRDGTDFLSNIERLNFHDIGLNDPNNAHPKPAKDILTKDANNVAFDRTNAHLISKEQLLANDVDFQGDSLRITQLFDTQGGTATLTEQGDVLFTPDASFTGIMGFKYTVIDSQGNVSATVQETGTNNTAMMRAAVYLKTPDLPTDPLVTDQWYLSDANIVPVWKDYSGKGVRIGQFEPGSTYSVTKEVLNYRHPDLQSNIDQSWLANATPGQLAGDGSEDKFSAHASLVAGVMVAARNGEGAVGVAYDATVAGHWIDGYLVALDNMAWYDVANNSWGYDKAFSQNFNNFLALEGAYMRATRKGRSGLGTAIVMAAGNERAAGGNANTQSTNNNRYSIAVGAINAVSDLGALQVGQAPFSNPGANILVAAPGSNVTSTSRLIENGNGSVFGSDYETSQGTSFATPIVSAIIALMLEANPKLGYRDIQEILAISAKKIEDPNTDWRNNHTNTWNGGGMHFSHDYGFGEVDARAAVRLAETWITQQAFGNEQSTGSISSGTLNSAIPDNDASGISSTITVTNAPLKIEHAEITVNLTHAYAGDLVIKLVSPTGTESVLLNRIGKAPGSVESVRGDATFNGSNTLSFTFSTTQDWNEAASGDWTLKVIDAATENTGTLANWSLNLYGKYDDGSGSDSYIYTNEYAQLAATGGRNLLNDTDGGEDTVNAAAASGNTIINLADGNATIAGAALTIVDSVNIENAIGGEGNDTLIGNGGSNKLIGGRGNDALDGGAGADYLFGGFGNNTLTGGGEGDMFVIDKKPGAIDIIADFQVGVDRIILSGFDGTTYANLALAQEGSNVRVNIAAGQSILVQNVTVAQMNAEQFLSIRNGLSPRDLNSPLFSGLPEWGSYKSVVFGSDAFVSSGTSWDSGAILYWAGDNVGSAGQQYESIWGGIGFDKIYGGAGDDLIEGDPSSGTLFGGYDYLSGEDGRDVLDGRGGNDTLLGGAGSDLLVGGYGDDVLYCEGDDDIRGFSGLSLADGSQNINGTYIGDFSFTVDWFAYANVVGDAGNDRFVVTEDITAEASKGLLKNVIYDFETSNPYEKIDLSKIRSVRSFADLQFNTVTVDVLGTPQNYLRVWLGSKAPGTQYISMKGITQAQLSADNFVFYDGYSLPPLVRNASINGTAGADALIGDAGGNTLDGDTGADTLTGRTGDDTYIVDNAGDIVEELPGGGFDTIKSSVNYTLPAETENLILTGSADINGTGNDKANRITGNSGKNTLDGQGGSDTMIGGAGNDVYVVNAGTDTVIEQEGEGTDTVQSSVSYTLGANVENVTLTGTANINATGNTLNNVLTGNAGDNMLNGDAGNDTLSGGAGSDTYLFIKGAGQDTINNYDTSTGKTDVLQLMGILASEVALSRSGNDLLVTINGTIDKVTVQNFFALSGGGVNRVDQIRFDDGTIWDLATLTAGLATINGTVGDDNLKGTACDDVVNAGAGNDSIYGYAGDDILNGEDGNDFLFDADGNDILSGGAGNDLLTANNGNDTLIGGAGNDNLSGDAGSDIYIFRKGDGQDSISNYDNSTGGKTDILQLAGILTSEVTLNRIGSNLVLSINGATDKVTIQGYFTNDGDWASKLDQIKFDDGTMWDIATIKAKLLVGTAGNDTLIGYASDDMINGGAGNDNVSGNAGNDSLNGEDGNDTINGGDGNDIASGGNGADYLYGSAGNDTLNGGAGSDYLSGDAGSDTYVFAKGAGQDTIGNYDFSTGKNDVLQLMGILSGEVTLGRSGNDLIVSLTGTTDKVTIQGYFISDGASANKLEQIKFDDGTMWDIATIKVKLLEGTAGNDMLTGYASDDVINGGAGNDNAYGNAGNDIVNGDSGADYLYGGAGNDTLAGGAGNDYLLGDAGSDTYVFARGAGQDTISNYDSSIGKTDVLQLVGILPGEVALGRSGSDLVVSINGTTDKVTIQGYLTSDGNSASKLEQIRFDDGTTWDLNVVKFKLFSGTAGNESITALGTNDLLNGGAGKDTLDGGNGNDFLIGGAGNDSITTGAGYDVVAFNRGDGQDSVVASTGKDNTLSLGHGIQYADLLFSKSVNDLILATGANEQVTFKDWYASVNNHSIANLQMVIEGTADYDAASANAVNNKKVERFNFDGLVTAFDQARTANPALTSWALSSSLLNFHLGGSDTAAIGGDLAYQYAKDGNLSAISMTPAQAILGSAQFGGAAQNLQAVSALQDASPRLM